MRALPFFLSLTLPLSVYFGITSGGIYIYSTVVILMLIHPFFDLILKREMPGDDIEEFKTAGSQIPLLIYPFIQTALFIWAIWFIKTENPDDITWTMLMYSTGFSNGAIGLAVAHELIHKQHPLKRATGIFLLLQVLYPHYRIEHVYGHHIKVGTRADSATARRGETIYTFWFRSIISGLINAWNFEWRRLKTRTVLSRLLKNRMIHYILMTATLMTGIAFYGGKQVLLFYIAQSFVAFSLLEIIDFVEHYGLSRKELKPGIYEPVAVHHTWDSGHRMTNLFVFNLGKHAHHHEDANLTYERLKLKKGAKKLPFGYSLMLLLAFVPPLFERAVKNELDT